MVDIYGDIYGCHDLGRGRWVGRCSWHLARMLLDPLQYKGRSHHREWPGPVVRVGNPS